jgi:glucose-1-phosphate thymidylyltransferase
MKGLILSGGKGSRLYPITYTNAKQLVPVANQPVLYRVIEAIRDAGISDIGVVVGIDDNARQVREAVSDGRRWGVKTTFLAQEAPLGLAHAVKISREFLGDDRFVMFLGDNVIQGGISDLIRRFETSQWDAQVVLKAVEQPQHYGVAELDEHGCIARLVEKPPQPRSNLALVGIYMFSPCIFEAVNNILPSWRGELEITDALQWLIAHGYRVEPYIHQGWWIDTGKTTDMLDANNRVLDEMDHRITGYVDRDSHVSGKVTVEKGAEIINSVIRGPAVIGEDTRIVNSYIGPFTSIYHHCLIENSEIEHSIVLENCRVLDIPVRIEDSLIGRNASITRSPIKPKAHKLILGDNSQVGIL